METISSKVLCTGKESNHLHLTVVLIIVLLNLRHLLSLNTVREKTCVPCWQIGTGVLLLDRLRLGDKFLETDVQAIASPSQVPPKGIDAELPVPKLKTLIVVSRHHPGQTSVRAEDYGVVTLPSRVKGCAIGHIELLRTPRKLAVHNSCGGGHSKLFVDVVVRSQLNEMIVVEIYALTWFFIARHEAVFITLAIVLADEASLSSIFQHLGKDFY